jgi:hypothetical protein
MDEYKKGLVGYTNQRPAVKPQLPLADYEKDTIAYFFAKLKLTDQRFYTQAMPDEKTEQITKRDYSNQLRYLTNEQIDKGFTELRKLMAANHPEYKFMTIPKAIGLCDGTAAVIVQEGIQAGSHKPFEHVLMQLPEPPDYRTKRYEEGVKQTAALLAMLEDKPVSKPQTAADREDLEKLERIRNGQ